MNQFSAVLLAAFLTSSFADVPDDSLTPGVVAETNVDVVCAQGYSKRHRHTTNEDRYQVYREYGIPRGNHCCVIDHRVPLELGGADVRENEWPQLKESAKQKDMLENAIHDLVCNWHELPLSDAQQVFLLDWRKGYQAVFGSYP